MTDLADDLEDFVSAVNARGIAGIFTRNSKDGNHASEALQFSCWRNAVERSRGLVVECWKRNPDDPPDFFAIVNGEKIGVELTELVDEGFLDRMESDQTPKLSTQNGEGFLMTQWTRSKFEERLSKIIEKKREKYKKNGVSIDILAIVTGEPWLAESQVKDWLTDIQFPRFPEIKQVDLVLGYHGGAPGHYPLFRLA